MGIISVGQYCHIDRYDGMGVIVRLRSYVQSCHLLGTIDHQGYLRTSIVQRRDLDIIIVGNLYLCSDRHLRHFGETFHADRRNDCDPIVILQEDEDDGDDNGEESTTTSTSTRTTIATGPKFSKESAKSC